LAEWSLLTNHARLLLAIEQEPGLRIREMADRLSLSERGVHLILRDLRESGYVTARRGGNGDGRRVYFEVVPTKPLRSNSVRHHTVGELLQLLSEAEASAAKKPNARGQSSDRA
jgi:predicted ArsR family transcriptional regulator